jgi:hypothetical protein
MPYGAVPWPNLSLTITPPGGSPTAYASNLSWSGTSQTVTISQNFGRQGDTATMVLTDDWQGGAHPNFSIPVLSQISLFDNYANVNLFAGVVNDPTLLPTGANRNEWVLQCTDYTFYADNTVVQGTFNGLSIDEIAVLLTAQANCGITAASVLNGGFVSPAPVINTVSFNYVTLSQAWSTLAQLAGTSVPYGWYVDQNLALHFFSSDTAQASGTTFTTAVVTGGSLVEGHIVLDTNFAYEWDGTTIHNKILVQGATQTFYANTSGAPTNIWKANGVDTAWPLKFTATGTPTLTVNGVDTAVQVVTPTTAVATPTAWNVQQNAFGGWFLGAATAPADGSVIRLWYDYQVPIIAQATDAASIAAYPGPNGGVYEEFISDSTLTTAGMAQARAQRERTEYAFAAERTTFTTSPDWLGWVRAGQTFGYVNSLVPDSQNSYTWGVNDTFICISNTVTFGQTGQATSPYRSMNITGVRI